MASSPSSLKLISAKSVVSSISFFKQLFCLHLPVSVVSYLSELWFIKKPSKFNYLLEYDWTPVCRDDHEETQVGPFEPEFSFCVSIARSISIEDWDWSHLRHIPRDWYAHIMCKDIDMCGYRHVVWQFRLWSSRFNNDYFKFCLSCSEILKESTAWRNAFQITPKGLHREITYGHEMNDLVKDVRNWCDCCVHGPLFGIHHELERKNLFTFHQRICCIYDSDCSPQVAFIRFLSLLVSHDWSASPIIVNLNNELNMQEIEEIYSSFTSQRSTLPQMVIATPLDKRGSMWTKNMSSAVILKRIMILADASLKSLDDILNSTKISDIKVIFRPPLESFDVLIYLKRKEIPTISYAVDAYKTDSLPVHVPYKHELNELFPIVEYNPVKIYLEELRKNFGDFAIFLHDIYGGDIISVVWKRSTFTAKEFKASNAYCRTLYGDGSRVIPDAERILEDFQILGAGLVEQIVKQTENWQIP